MIISVSELNSLVKEFFDLNPVFNSLYVKGEISNFKKHTSGHCYFSLKDENAVIKAVMFKYSAMSLSFMPENGMKVIVNARLSSYERDGVYQLYVNEMQPDGIGALHIKFEQLKLKLEEEGLFDQSYKKELPRFPKTVGVVTSKTGAAIRDIINVIKRRSPGTDIIIYPASVQGSEAHHEIAEGIEYFNKNKVDVMIVGRGGGSYEDLWCFNEEKVARAIFDSVVPVVSAVGHETDYTIADFVADLRAPTPSAAAELCVSSKKETLDYISLMRKRLYSSVNTSWAINKSKLENLKNNNVFKYPERLFEKYQQNVSGMSESLCNSFGKIISKNKELFIKNISMLDTLSPLKVLKRGYTFVENEKGEVVDSVNKTEIDSTIKLKFSDGSLKCKVVSKEE